VAIQVCSLKVLSCDVSITFYCKDNLTKKNEVMRVILYSQRVQIQPLIAGGDDTQFYKPVELLEDR